MHAQESPAERVAEIQAALRDAKLDGWLFYDFRHSDPLAYRILKLDEKMLASRRWFYYIPATGEPVKIVQSIEQFKLDSLPGRKLIFRGWQELHARLREVLAPAAKESKRRIAMQYSPMNDIPYISRVDAGTIELVRSFGIEPVTFIGIVVLLVASAWNIWPLPAVESCSCNSKNGKVTTRVPRRVAPY